MYEEEKIQSAIKADNDIKPPKEPEKVKGEPPVISTYNQIKFDLYKLFQDYSVAYGSYKALEYDNRHNSKEAKTYAQLMTSYCLQFHGIVANGWHDTKERMKQNETSIRGADFINKFGTLFGEFDKLAQRLMNGGRFRNPELKSKNKVRLDADDFALCFQLISSFIHFSGIGDIEGRFQEEASASGFSAEF